MTLRTYVLMTSKNKNIDIFSFSFSLVIALLYQVTHMLLFLRHHAPPLYDQKNTDSSTPLQASFPFFLLFISPSIRQTKQKAENHHIKTKQNKVLTIQDSCISLVQVPSSYFY